MPLSNTIGTKFGTLVQGINEICVAYNNITEAFDFCHNAMIKNATAKMYVYDLNTQVEVPYESLIYMDMHNILKLRYHNSILVI